MAASQSYRIAATGAALVLTLALAACGDRGKGKTAAEDAPTARSLVEAAADPCTSVSTAFGEALCGDPDLQGLVGQVKTNLVQAAGDIPVDAARQVAEGQQQWLESVRIGCGIGGGKIPLSTEQEACVSGALKRRVDQAAQTITQRGGYTFQAVELNRAAPMVEAAGAGAEFAPTAITQEIRFPRIQGDAPAVRRFNELMAQRPQYGLTDQVSEYVDYNIAFAGPELISVRFSSSENAAGAIRPSNDEKVVTVVMATGEPLKEADVFSAPEARWKAFIVQRVTRDLRRQFNAIDPGIELRAAEVADTATKTKNWLVTEDALVVLFPPESIGPHALGNFEVKIPWADMKALLNPAAPAPIRRS
jgi:Protein of unknown function (DUF3298)